MTWHANVWIVTSRELNHLRGFLHRCWRWVTPGRPKTTFSSPIHYFRNHIQKMSNTLDHFDGHWQTDYRADLLAQICLRFENSHAAMPFSESVSLLGANNDISANEAWQSRWRRMADDHHFWIFKFCLQLKQPLYVTLNYSHRVSVHSPVHQWWSMEKSESYSSHIKHAGGKTDQHSLWHHKPTNLANGDQKKCICSTSS